MNREEKIKILEVEREDYKKDYIFQIKHLTKLAAHKTGELKVRDFLKDQMDERTERIKTLKEEIFKDLEKKEVVNN